MGNPQPPEDQAPPAEGEIDEVAADPQETSGGVSGGEKPDGHYSG